MARNVLTPPGDVLRSGPKDSQIRFESGGTAEQSTNFFERDEEGQPKTISITERPAGLAVKPPNLHLVNVGSIPTGPTHGGRRLQPHPGDVLTSTPKFWGSLSLPSRFKPDLGLFRTFKVDLSTSPGCGCSHTSPSMGPVGIEPTFTRCKSSG